MYRPKKKIPRLAIAALPLAGFGSSGCADSSASITDAINAYCMKTIECYGADVLGNTAVEDCVADYAEYDDSDNYSAACINAYASYFACAAKLPCEQFVLGEGSSLSPELDACYYGADFESACPPVSGQESN
jgi:hypothetical protein